MADTVAIVILALFLAACGLGPGCNFKGPGLQYEVDGQNHYFKFGHHKE